MLFVPSGSVSSNVPGVVYSYVDAAKTVSAVNVTNNAANKTKAIAVVYNVETFEITLVINRLLLVMLFSSLSCLLVFDWYF